MSLPPCPNCSSEYVYQDQNNLVCPECAYEWNPTQDAIEAEASAVRDINGNKLEQGDKITIIKDLKVKGSSSVVKIGAKGIVKRVTVAKDHQLDCKIEGWGEILITAKYVKKA